MIDITIMDDINIPIFAQAKIEYTKQLVEILYPHMYDGLKSIYDESKTIYSTKTNVPIMLLFRELLEKVPIWNSEIIEGEASRIIQSSGCDWIDDLITAVFISHTKILTSIGPNQSFQKINVTIPKTTTFIHKSYINVAREIWKNPYLFNEHVPGHEFQRNSKGVEDIIKGCIETTVRNLLPIKEILREHLDTHENESLMTQKDELKRLLREELRGLKENTPPNIAMDHSSTHQEGPNIEQELEQELELEQEPMDEIIEENSGELYIESPDVNALTDTVSGVNYSSDKPTDTPLLGDSGQLAAKGDPSDDQVNEQCAGIVVNDITLPVDVDTGISAIGPDLYIIPEPTIVSAPAPEPEPVYDNTRGTHSITGTYTDTLKLQRMQDALTTGDPTKGNTFGKSTDIHVIKDQNIKSKPNDIKIPSYSLSNLYPNLYHTPEPKAPEPKAPEPKAPENHYVPVSPRKDVASIQSNELDETSSLANFFNDVKQIVEDKGIKVDTTTSSDFTLFEDASEMDS